MTAQETIAAAGPEIKDPAADLFTFSTAERHGVACP